jgi:hypothetical protein
MSSSPERQESEAVRAELSPEVSSNPQVSNKLAADHQKHLLPADLLTSSPEMENAGTTTTEHAVVTPRPLRHHDVIMERNDRFEDDVWGRISAALPPRGQRRQEVQTAPAILEEPRAAGPMTPHLEQSQVPPTLQPATFLAPGQGRTPQQAAAAARLRDAVAARARLQEDPQRRQANLTSLRDSAANDGAQVDTDRRREYPHAQARQDGPTKSGGFAWPPTIRTPATRRPIAPSPPSYRSAPPESVPGPAPFPAPFNNSAAQPPLPAPASPVPPDIPGATTTAITTHNHQGDSIFRQMMDQLITTGTIPPGAYQQVNLSFRPPYGMEYLYIAEWIHAQHWLFTRARQERSGGGGGDARAIRSARNGEIVGWREFLAGGAAGRIHLIPTPNPGKWVPR